MQLTIVLIISIFISDCIGPPEDGPHGHRRSNHSRPAPHQSGRDNYRHGNGVLILERIKYPPLRPDMKVVHMVAERDDMLFRILHAFTEAIAIDSDLTYLSVDAGALNRFLPQKFLASNGSPPLTSPSKVFVNGDTPKDGPLSSGPPPTGTAANVNETQSDGHGIRSASLSEEDDDHEDEVEPENHSGKRKKRATGDQEEQTSNHRDSHQDRRRGNHRDSHHDRRRDNHQDSRARREEGGHGRERIDENKFRKPRSETIFIPALQKFIVDASMRNNKDSIKVAKDILEEGTKLIREHYIVHVNPTEREHPPPTSSRFDWLTRIFDLGKKQVPQNQQKTDKAAGGIKGLAIQDIDISLNNFYDLIERVKLIEMKTRIFNFFQVAVKGKNDEEKEKIFSKYKYFINKELLREDPAGSFRFKIVPEVVAVINADEIDKAIKEYTNWDRFKRGVRNGYFKYNSVAWNSRLWAQLHQVKNEFDKIAP
ncbi:hypothetical protein Ddc_14675 [Ditylenchus destructor]|nr:hypothetical protein Ddc_14675 [Ditylenchus destructor]